MNSVINMAHQFFKALATMSLLALLLTGCGTYSVMLNSEPPLPVSSEIKASLRKVAVSDIISSVPADQIIGEIHQGLLKLESDSFFLAGPIFGDCHMLIRTAIKDELYATGYQFVETGELVEAAKGKGIASNMLIDGRILDIKFDAYTTIFHEKSHAEVTVEWSIFDSAAKAVVFSLETSGAADGPGVRPLSSLPFAVRASFREFLKDERFMESLKIATSQ